MLSEKEQRAQALALAKLRQAEIARKSKNVVKAGVLPSQWGKQTSLDKLVSTDHMVKSGGQASLESSREMAKDAKIAEKNGMSFDEYRLAKRFGTLPKIVERIDRT